MQPSEPGLVHVPPWYVTQQLVLRETGLIYKIPTLVGVGAGSTSAWNFILPGDSALPLLSIRL